MYKKRYKKANPTLIVRNKMTANEGETGWKGNLLLNYPTEWLRVIKNNQE